MSHNAQAKDDKHFYDLNKCVDEIFNRLGKDIILGMPLALGKSYDIANEIYNRAKNDKSINLTIATALSLEKPEPTSELEKRMLEPLYDRIWKGVPDFEYMKDLRKNNLPENVTIKEFYCKPGANKNSPHLQQNHYASNYTHVGRDMVETSDNIVYCHSVAKKEINNTIYYSDSCNADLSTDMDYLMPKARAEGKKGLNLGHVNSYLPFMEGDAVNTEDNFDIILDSPDYYTPLFSVPKEPVTIQDHAIGLHVSTLIPDDGTLQIGIGSLGDAIANALILRHQKNNEYQKILDSLSVKEKYSSLIKSSGDTKPFKKGLYGATEMLVEAFISLFNAGIIKRKVYDYLPIQSLINQNIINEDLNETSLMEIFKSDYIYPIIKEKDFYKLQGIGVINKSCKYKNYKIILNNKEYDADLREENNLNKIIQDCCGKSLINGSVLHGGFFIGSNNFYDILRNLSDEQRSLINMTGVKKINQLYGDEDLRTLQRKNARFINTAMIGTITGNVVSDALESGTIISGVGGQYNFVSMAHAIEGARSIIMIKSTKEGKGEIHSNIVFNYGNTTIPRHLKDVVVTEYGIADLRGRVDNEVVKRIINIADSRFQDDLLRKAKKARKLEKSYTIPPAFKNNSPIELEKKIKPYKDEGILSLFPFGCDFTQTEIALGKALRKLKFDIDADKPKTLLSVIKEGFNREPESAKPYLERMNINSNRNIKDKLISKLVIYALKNAEVI